MTHTSKAPSDFPYEPKAPPQTNWKHKPPKRTNLRQGEARTLRKIWHDIKAEAKRQNAVLDPFWENFDTFAGWAMENGWKQGLWIDRNIMGYHARIYGPGRPDGPGLSGEPIPPCCVADEKTSKLLRKLFGARDNHKGKLPVGVRWSESTQKFEAHSERFVSEPFDDEIEAYVAYCDHCADLLYAAAKEQTNGHMGLGLSYLADDYRLRLIAPTPKLGP